MMLALSGGCGRRPAGSAQGNWGTMTIQEIQPDELADSLGITIAEQKLRTANGPGSQTSVSSC